MFSFPDNKVGVSGIERVADSYSSSSSARMIMTALPVVGSAIDAALSTDAQNRFQDRTKYLFEQINHNLQSLKEEAVNYSYLQSEEFADLIVLSYNESRKTRSKNKIMLYSKILTQALKSNFHKKYSPEEYLCILANLTDKEVYVASQFYEAQKGKNDVNPEINDLQWLKSINWKEGREQELRSEFGEDFDLIVRRIASTGLLKEITGVYAGNMGGQFIITPSFSRLMRFLSD